MKAFRVAGAVSAYRKMLKKKLSPGEADAERESRKHAEEVGPRYAKSSRQQARREKFAQEFAQVCQQFGGGVGWMSAKESGHAEPRKARRKIARARIKR
jgi:hypothetical protein